MPEEVSKILKQLIKNIQFESLTAKMNWETFNLTYRFVWIQERGQGSSTCACEFIYDYKNDEIQILKSNY